MAFFGDSGMGFFGMRMGFFGTGEWDSGAVRPCGHQAAAPPRGAVGSPPPFPDFGIFPREIPPGKPRDEGGTGSRRARASSE